MSHVQKISSSFAFCQRRDILSKGSQKNLYHIKIHKGILRNIWHIKPAHTLMSHSQCAIYNDISYETR